MLPKTSTTNYSSTNRLDLQPLPPEHMKNEIIPAILVETFDEFRDRMEICEDFAETVQWDIMDGRFVEQMTFSDISKLKQIETVLSMELHLMVEGPEELLDDLIKSGVDRVIIHAESVDNLRATIDRLKGKDFELGVAINPETSVEDIEEFIPDLDEVMVMTVVPGASGQAFLAEELGKVTQLRTAHPDLNIAVDGGINRETIKLAKAAGANRFAVNSAIFASLDPGNAFELLQSMVE